MTIRRTTLIICALLSVITAGAHSAPMPGDRISPISLPTPASGIYNWKPGRVTVFSFCAFWCDTWKAQSQRLDATEKALTGLPVDFLTISVDGRWSEQGRGKVPGKLLLDKGRVLSKRLGINSVPYTLVVAAGGRVLHSSQGITRGEVLRSILGEVVNGVPNDGGKIYLTFDDFPSGKSDHRLLDVLRANGVHATFFCVGSRIGSTGGADRRAADEDHSLQVHSWNHDGSDPQIERCVKAIASVAGKKPTLYRPPGRSACLVIQGGELKKPVVNAYDYTRPGRKELIRRILPAVKPEFVILLHAGVSDTIDVLPEMVKFLRKRGYEFDVLR